MITNRPNRGRFRRQSKAPDQLPRRTGVKSSPRRALAVRAGLVCLVLAVAATPRASSALTLAEAMARAVSNTEAAALLETDVDIAEAAERVALGELLPLLRATGQSVRNQEEIRLGDSVFVNLWDHNANVRLSVDVFRGTAIPSWVSASRAADAAALQARWQNAGLRLAAARTYLAGLTARSNLQSARESAVLRQASLEQAELLLESGYGTAADVSRARFSLIEAQTAVVTTERNLADAVDTLRFVINAPEITADDLIDPSLDGIGAATSAPNIEDLSDTRADLRALEADIASREAATTAQWLSFLPTFSVAGQYVIGPESLRAPDRTYWFITLSATWDLFDFRRYGRLDGAEAAERAAVLELDQSRRALLTELSTTLRRLETAESVLELTELAVEAAMVTRDLEAERYTAGDATVLELTTANVALFRAQVASNVAQLERDLSIVEMAYFTGQLEDDSWPEDDTELDQ